MSEGLKVPTVRDVAGLLTLVGPGGVGDAEAVPPRKIVVGLDGSIGSARGLAWAVDIARALGAEIVAVHVFQLIPRMAAASAPIPDTGEWQQLLRQNFENEWCAPLRNAGVRYRTIFQMGTPAATLINIARREQADLLVTGTRGVGGFKELMLGSVSHQLVLHATVPVVVIPADVERATVAPESTPATAVAR